MIKYFIFFLLVHKSLFAPEDEITQLIHELEDVTEKISATSSSITTLSSEIENETFQSKARLDELETALKHSKQSLTQAYAQQGHPIVSWNLSRIIQQQEFELEKTREHLEKKIRLMILRRQSLVIYEESLKKKLGSVRFVLEFKHKLVGKAFPGQTLQKHFRSRTGESLEQCKLKSEIPTSRAGYLRINWLIKLLSIDSFINLLIQGSDCSGPLTCQVCMEPLIDIDLANAFEIDHKSKRILTNDHNIEITASKITLPYNCIENSYGAGSVTIEAERVIPFLSHILHAECSTGWAVHSATCPSCRVK